MQVVERSALVTYTPAQMFALVNDVPRYPEFLPWCIGVRVEDVSPTRAHRDAENGARRACGPNSRRATRSLRMRRFDMQPHARTVSRSDRRMALRAIGTRGCRVHFKVEFEFKNRLTSAAFNAVFETLCGSIVDAFVVRAQKIYGLEVPDRDPRRDRLCRAAAQRRQVFEPGAGCRDCRCAAPGRGGSGFHGRGSGECGGRHIRQSGAREISCCKDGDRIEIYRPLAEEPKLARRTRAKQARDATPCIQRGQRPAQPADTAADTAR